MPSVIPDREARRKTQRQLFIIVGVTLGMMVVILVMALNNVFFPRRVWPGVAGMVVIGALLFPLLSWAGKESERHAAEQAAKAAREAERQGKPRQFR